MISKMHCVLCVSGEHRPEYHDSRTTTLGHVVLGDDQVSMDIVEHYRIIDERLPYDERFEISHYTLEVGIGYDSEKVASVTVERFDMLRVAQAFLSSALAVRTTR